MRVSRDVVFDEMASWYLEENKAIGADVKESVVTENAGPSSQVLSGPQGQALLKDRGVAGCVVERALLAHQ